MSRSECVQPSRIANCFNPLQSILDREARWVSIVNRGYKAFVNCAIVDGRWALYFGDMNRYGPDDPVWMPSCWEPT